MFYKIGGKTVAWVQSDVDFLVRPKEQKEKLLASKPKVTFAKRSLIKSCIDRDYGWPKVVRSRI